MRNTSCDVGDYPANVAHDSSQYYRHDPRGEDHSLAAHDLCTRLGGVLQKKECIKEEQQAPGAA